MFVENFEKSHPSFLQLYELASFNLLSVKFQWRIWIFPLLKKKILSMKTEAKFSVSFYVCIRYRKMLIGTHKGRLMQINFVSARNRIYAFDMMKSNINQDSKHRMKLEYWYFETYIHVSWHYIDWFTEFS